LVGVRETYASIGNGRNSKHLELRVLSTEAEVEKNPRIGIEKYGVSEDKIKEMVDITPVSSPSPVGPSPPPVGPSRPPVGHSPPPISGYSPYDVDAVTSNL
jgi:hypothetical protein